MLKQRAATPTSAAKPPRLVRNYGRIILVSLLALSILIAGGQYALYRSEQDWGAVTPDTMTLTTTERFLALPASPAHTETRTVTIHWADDGGYTVGGYYDALHSAPRDLPVALTTDLCSPKTPSGPITTTTITFSWRGKTLETWTQPHCGNYALTRGGVTYSWWTKNPRFPSSDAIRKYEDSFLP